MDTPKESPGQSRAKFWFVFALFVVLMALAHGGAELRGWLDARSAPAVPDHTVLYYRVIFTIWAAILLLTPALCLRSFIARKGRASILKESFSTPDQTSS